MRKGGYTYEWLLDTQITDKLDRNRMRALVLNRTGNEADAELNAIASDYNEQGVKNMGTTEIVTDKIFPADILGYFEIRQDLGPQPYRMLKELKNIEDYKLIPDDDIECYKRFLATNGSLPTELSTFM